jgi:hypothetical protein
VTVNGRPWRVNADETGYVAISREWHSGDVIDVHLPMTLRTEALPGVPSMVAFAYGPVVLAGALGHEGVTPSAQIIKNERESGTMLNAPIEIPTLAGDQRALLSRISPVVGEPLAFTLADTAVKLAPYFRTSHDRYVLYWQLP